MAEEELKGQENQRGETPPKENEKPRQEAAAKHPSKDACTMAMLCHLLAIFTWFLGPLIIWLIKKDEDKFIDDQGKEALNFQITITIGYAISGALAWTCMGFIAGITIWILQLIFCIMGTVKASDGKAYRYPINIRLIK